MQKNITLLVLCVLIHAIAAGQSTYTVTLRTDADSINSFYRNEPLVFSVSLANNTYLENLQWNNAADKWLQNLSAELKAKKISKEEYETKTERVLKGKKTVKVDTIGSHELPWFRQLQFRIVRNDSGQTILWPLSVLGDPLTDSVAILDENAYYRIQYHLSPEQTGKLEPATYWMNVSLAGVKSNEVRITIRPEAMPLKVLKSRRMQLRFGNYYLQQKNADEAIRYAEALLQKNPEDIAGLVLKGESYIVKKQYGPALGEFDKALKLHRKKSTSHEPPEYLMGTIAWLKEKLR